MKKTTFGIVGAGWRTEFFLRVAAALPDEFVCGGVYARSESGQARMAPYGVPVFTDYETFCKAPFDFVISCVKYGEILPIAEDLLARGHAVLCETPIAAHPDDLAKVAALPENAPIQVAEQYLFQPYYAALKNIAASGLLGEPHYIRVSAAHAYHGTSLLRGLLGVGMAMPDRVEAIVHDDRLRRMQGRPGRLPGADVVSRQYVGLLQFGAKSAVFDFTGEQYYSPIRTGNLLLRGPRGEIQDNTLTYLDNGDNPVTLPIARTDCGRFANLDGFCLARINLGADVVWENPYPHARFTDEEVAVATTLARMSNYVRGGAPFYTPAEAALDSAIAFLIEDAANRKN